jgi:hypothetical protein
MTYPAPNIPPQRDSFRERLREFFFAEEVPFGMALVRIVLPLVLLLPTVPRWQHARELYSSDGAPAPLWESYNRPGMLPVLSGDAAVAAQTALILALVASSVGWRTRTSLTVAVVLFSYLNLSDAVSTITKYSVIATHGLVMLALSRCGEIWSVDSWLRGGHRRRFPSPGLPAADYPRYPAWPRRLMQLMLGFVYFGAAVTKVHTPTFFTGDQMIYWMITDMNRPHPMGFWLAQHPNLVVLSSYVAVVFEFTFVFLCWRGTARTLTLLLGVVFHAMTFFLLGLHVFPFVCCAMYLAFFNEGDWRLFAQRLRRVRRRLGWKPSFQPPRPQTATVGGFAPQSAGLWAFAMTAAIVVGLAVERKLDYYGERRPEGPHELVPIDRETVRRMIAPSEPLRPADKVFALDLGSRIIGEFLVNNRTRFRHGEALVAQLSLNPPHEDMVVACALHGPDGRMVERIPLQVPRERTRAHFLFPLQAVYEPGEYEVVLTSSGNDLARRRFQLVADESGQRVSAN